MCLCVTVRDILALCLALRFEEVKTENGNCSSCCCVVVFLLNVLLLLC